MFDKIDFESKETPSVYFNDIIRKNVTLVTIDALDTQVIKEFNRQVAVAFPDEAELSIRRLHYIAPYILQNIDWDEYHAPLEALHLRYYYQRQRFLINTGLSPDTFARHKPMQQAIKDLGLMPEPVFEFILFLKYYYNLRSDLRYSCIEQFDRLIAEFDKTPPPAGANMDVNIGGKHFKINNTDFIQRLFRSVDRSRLTDHTFINEFNQGSLREKVRALDYYIVKTLLDYLPTDKTLRCGGRFSQAERNFGLSVLSLCGRLPDIDREGECGPENNATFDKLMRDFVGQPIPFAMELYL